jgi:integrase
MKYRKNDGKEGLLTFGGFPAVSLEQARKLRDEAKAAKATGVDPGTARREEKAERLNRAKNTFEAVSRNWMDVHGTKVKPQTMHIYKVVLEKFVFPLIGKTPVRDLKAPDFLAMLRRLEAQGQLYTVKRIAIVCGLIMRFAVATGHADIDPLPSLRGSLKSHKTKHLAAMTDPKQVGRLMRAIDAYSGSFVVSCALKIAPYVFVRPGELRHARWADIDFESCEWRYLATKTETPHIVPLAPQVMTILSELRLFTGEGEWVFPSLWEKGEPMGKTTLLAALRHLGISGDDMTPHGFRAMARTLLDEVLGERYEFIEMQLAHMVRDPNGRAYNRTVHLAERKRMMARWADYLDGLRAEAGLAV